MGVTQIAGDARLLIDVDQRARLVRLCAAISRDADAAEDLAQETLAVAWRRRATLREPASLGDGAGAARLDILFALDSLRVLSVNGRG